MNRDGREEQGAKPRAIEAVLFDVDGVVTDTAEAHAAAWNACSTPI